MPDTLSFFLLPFAIKDAMEAHDSIGQKRKHNGEPYWTHVLRVFRNLVQLGITDEDILIASLFHDIFEDVTPKNPKYNPVWMAGKYGERVARLVFALTDIYTHEAYPHRNRLWRKQKEAERLSVISDDAITIKIADIIDNSEDISVNDPKFYQRLLVEKREIFLAWNNRDRLIDTPWKDDPRYILLTNHVENHRRAD